MAVPAPPRARALVYGIEAGMTPQASLIDELETQLRTGTNAGRVSILRKVTDLFVLSAKDITETQVEIFDDVMIRLIEQIEDKILAELSECLATIDNSPANVIAQLARNDRIEVAGPVLEKSNRLSDIDLVEIAYTKSQAHLSAIASRAQINPAVAEVLIRRGGTEVALKLAANPGAAFSSESFSTLVQRALDNKNLAATISERADVPPELYEFLVLRATERVKKHLVATCKPEVRPRVETLLSKVSSRIVQQAAAFPRANAGWSTTTMIKRDLATLRTQLDKFIAAGLTQEIVNTLAQLAAIPSETVKNVIRQSAEDGLLIICRASGISWPSVRALLKSRAWLRTPQDNELKAISDRYFRLSAESAQRVLLFMKARKTMAAAEMSQLLVDA
jgi:uncharacterized protein (DUF2336 family)